MGNEWNVHCVHCLHEILYAFAVHIENVSGLFFSLLSIRELLNCIIRDHLHIVLNGAGVCTVFAVFGDARAGERNMVCTTPNFTHTRTLYN